MYLFGSPFLEKNDDKHTNKQTNKQTNKDSSYYFKGWYIISSSSSISKSAENERGGLLLLKLDTFENLKYYVCNSNIAKLQKWKTFPLKDN